MSPVNTDEAKPTAKVVEAESLEVKDVTKCPIIQRDGVDTSGVDALPHSKSLEGAGHQSWTISTGRNKSFRIDDVNANDLHTVVHCMREYAFILQRGGFTPVIDTDNLMAHLAVVVDQVDTEKGIARAEEAARDFVFPDEVYTRDQRVLEATGSLTHVIETVQQQGLEQRFNVTRVEECTPETYEQYGILRDIALQGAPIDLPEVLREVLADVKS